MRAAACCTMPTVRASLPSTTAAAAAAESSPLPTGAPGVVVTGEVADTRDWLAAADIVVAPLRLARGVQNKVLEAMAMARPVVASPEAAQGIDARYGRDLIVARGSNAEARAVLDLLAAPEQAAVLGQAARARMAGRYGWEERMADLPRILGLD